MTLDVENVMARVREEVARRRGHAAPSPQRAPAGVSVAWAGALPPLAHKPEYSLHELLVYADRAFVENAYLAVLRRQPDPDGLVTHLDKLRSGEATKVEILAHLRWSAEGVARGVHVDGLLVPYTLQRWRRKRFIGPVITWLHALYRLGALSTRVSMVEAVQARDAFSLAEHVDRHVSQLGARSAALESAQVSLGASIQSAAKALDLRLDQLLVTNGAELERIQVQAETLGERLGQLVAAQSAQDARAASLGLQLKERSDALDEKLIQAADQLDSLRATMVSVEAQSDIIRQAIGGLQATLEAKDSLLSDHSHHLAAQGHALAQINHAREERERLERSLDPLYVAFEDHFRGSSALIRERALPYLDFIREAQVGGPANPILDVGCGHGDWLDLLRENGFVASGVDTNTIFVDVCRGRGLNVVAADAVEYLRAMPAGSLGGVTGMHIAEHLPFEVLIELLDQCRRVLCVGGLLALETPNPENLTVASLNFYMDPTHRNPLPPEAFRWIVEARGFEMTHIQRWTVARDMGAPPLLGDEVPGAASMNVLLSQLHAAPDYAIIARRLQ
jgi:O-antigen chain-terminating methyltransferase